MTTEQFIEKYEEYIKRFNIPLNKEEVLSWIEAKTISAEELDSINSFLSMMINKKEENAIQTLKRLSRIPQKRPFTFDNFSTENLAEKAKRQFNSLKTLSFINSKHNIIMIGPTGTGKTHLAMAIGNACCSNNIKSYFIKMSELKERFHENLINGSESRYIGALSKYACLIIDEVGYCKFNKEETLLFFQLVDRMSVKESGSIIITSNKGISEWIDLFEEKDALECILDRLCDRVFSLAFSGSSHRGKGQEEMEFNFTEFKK